ncbi:unnamed protein product [Microthlaspi erraticum]|uniref:Uncharacterized protein n=1 Tax=Microthlaspi erraticum TaxID=1685480 RepID=A0A6D2KJN0_9BRAS|nr:unnamed protein product [Microthlaspi erraticum]CAA7053232.1 unnamed protein product [Microthlaspi erraticum]
MGDHDSAQLAKLMELIQEMHAKMDSMFRKWEPQKGKPARVDQALGPTVKFTVEKLFDVPKLKQPKPTVEILVVSTVVQVMESNKNPEKTETSFVAEPKQPDRVEDSSCKNRSFSLRIPEQFKPSR